MSASWLKERLSHVHKSSKSTVAIVVDKTEIESLEFLGHLAKSSEFKQDLAMSKSYWFYSPDTLKRFLLIQH